MGRREGRLSDATTGVLRRRKRLVVSDQKQVRSSRPICGGVDVELALGPGHELDLRRRAEQSGCALVAPQLPEPRKVGARKDESSKLLKVGVHSGSSGTTGSLVSALWARLDCSRA